MEITQQQVGADMAVVTVNGKVMMGPESEQISEMVNELVRAGMRIIIFNIAGITKIDSTGIGRFIASYNDVAAVGGEMRIAGATKLLLQAFHICRLDTVFRFYPNVQDACEAA